MELTHLQTADKADDLHGERDKLQEQWLQAQARLSALEEELTQKQAHVDLGNIQLEEQNEEMEMIKVRIITLIGACVVFFSTHFILMFMFEQSRYKELYNMKAKADEEWRARVGELNAQHEIQVRTMRANHEQEVERLRDLSAQTLADVRENYQSELNTAKSQLERTLGEMRQNEGQDTARLRDDYNLRCVQF